MKTITVILCLMFALWVIFHDDGNGSGGGALRGTDGRIYEK